MEMLSLRMLRDYRKRKLIAFRGVGVGMYLEIGSLWHLMAFCAYLSGFENDEREKYVLVSTKNASLHMDFYINQNS